VTLDPAAYLTAIATPLATWFSASASKMCSLATLRFVKANNIDAAGHYADATTTHVHDYADGIVGFAAPVGPQFISRAITWETANARGPGHRGRIYPPNATVAIGTSAFKTSGTDRDVNTAAGASLIGVLKNASGANGVKGKPVVASKVNGALVTITGVSSDDVYDVQRRRKNRIKGSRSTITTI
jgi:hypothetical protein